MAIQLPFRLPHVNLGPRTRKVLRYVAFAVFAIVVFVFALQMSFPYERIKGKLIEAMQDKYDVTIGDVERGIIPGRVYFKAVSIRTRQTKPEEVVTTFYVEKLQLDLGLLPLLGGTIELGFAAKIGPGNIEGEIALGKFGRGDIRAEVEGESLPGANLPMRAVLGLPMTGKIEFAIDLYLPVEKSKMGRSAINWKRASGAFSLAWRY